MVHRYFSCAKIAFRCLGVSSSLIWGVVELCALQRLRLRAWWTPG